MPRFMAGSRVYRGGAQVSRIFYGTAPVFETSIYPMTDTFNGPFDTTKWPASIASPTTSGGQLVLMPATSAPAAVSNYIFNPATYRVFVEFVQRPTTGATGTTKFILQATGGQQVGFQLGSVNLSMICSSLTTVNVTYNNTTHRWLGISLVGGNLLCETSPDKITWTTRATFAAASWATSGGLRAVLTAQTADSPYTGTAALFDNFNIV